MPLPPQGPPFTSTSTEAIRAAWDQARDTRREYLESASSVLDKLKEALEKLVGPHAVDYYNVVPKFLPEEPYLSEMLELTQGGVLVLRLRLTFHPHRADIILRLKRVKKQWETAEGIDLSFAPDAAAELLASLEAELKDRHSCLLEGGQSVWEISDLPLPPPPEEAQAEAGRRLGL